MNQLNIKAIIRAKEVEKYRSDRKIFYAGLIMVVLLFITLAI